jgi:signal transduction histidine kinase
MIQDRLAPLIREVRPMITRLSQMNAQGIKLRNSEIQEEAGATHRLLHLDLLLGLVAAIGFAVVMGRRVVRPLAALTASAKAIALGNLDQDLPVKSRDELGQLAATFNQMIGELKRFRASDADRLQRASQTAQTAIDSLPDGVVMVEENRKVELANETATRLFGIAAGQHDVQRRLPWFEDALQRSDELPEGYKSSIQVDDNGISRSFLPRSVALKNADGHSIGWTLILVDVTAFQRLDQFKDSLLSMASHELKTPLTSMRMILPLLLEQTIGSLNSKQAELLTVTRDAMERMRQIVETILDLGRLASGKMPTDLRPVPPADLPAKCVEAMHPAFTAKGVNLRVEIPDGLAAVHCDSNHMYHVFSNLLSNALRHTPAGGSVVISAEPRATSMRFEVKDNGCGIAPAHLPQLFETFYRVPGQRSDTGTGLGLSLVKQIVEAHGGKVGVESVSNHGSAFWFTVPLAPPPAITDENYNRDQSDSHQPIGDDAVLAAR